MLISFRLVLALVVGAPALAFLDVPLAYGGLAVIAAVALTIATLSLHPGEAAHFARIARPVMLLAAVPAVWMTAQLVPAGTLGHPIWDSVGAALGRDLPSRISVDPGATFLALGHFLTALGIGIATLAVTIERQRAETLLHVLTLMTTVMALTIAVHDLGGFTFLGEIGRSGRMSFDAAAALGVVLSLAMADLSVERYETRRQAGMTKVRLIERLALALEALLICAIAVSFFQIDPLWIVALAGAGAFCLVVVVRRLGFGRGTGLGIAATAAVALVMVALAPVSILKGDLALRFSPSPPSQLISTGRMLDDASWAGSGAGTHAALSALYREAENSEAAAPTTAAAVIVEFGRPFFWLSTALAIVLMGFLLRGALGRGRDSFYAAAAAGCILVLILQGFRDASLFGPVMTVLAPAIVGLGLGQSVTRRLDGT